jgi:methionyl-tRNA synthetase
MHLAHTHLGRLTFLFQRELDAKGFIYKGNYGGWYSISDECFYPDTQVIRNHNQHSTESGKESVISTETGSIVEWMKEENYMFRLSSFRESLLAYYRANDGFIFPNSYLSHMVDTLSSASLEDLSISRPRSRLSWGIPVPNDPEHTIYVWFDALIVYLSGMGYPWRQRDTGFNVWPPDLQIIGKDILRLADYLRLFTVVMVIFLVSTEFIFQLCYKLSAFPCRRNCLPTRIGP